MKILYLIVFNYLNKKKIYFLLGLVLVVLAGVWIVSHRSPLKDILVNAGFLDEFKDLSVEKSTIFETKGSITGIDLYFDVKLKVRGY
ncbi:hypothetical protein GXP67_24325 [Rhodocytophaga rosea]|uniref:Uncharacterized protein n=1 Tax=Rhodocytophaga rosea TaxID=2704465 RepID=A0A6C0GNE1_9BACT|nr:hypothetical protein [Rhodocytophaga rosea]QHT69549.1 hypothetical protein GXP67_24325 [Rhodocytophaga rosea]